MYIKHLITGPEGNIEKFIKLPCNGSRQSTFTRGVGEPWVTVQCYDLKSKILAGNSFIVRCHVTLKSPMRACAIEKKFPATGI